MQKIFILVMMMFCSVGIAAGQGKGAKEAIARAELFDFPDAPIDSLCFVALVDGVYVWSVDGIGRSLKGAPGSTVILAPGIHSLSLSYVRKNQEFEGSLTIVVESGKYYRISVVDGDDTRYKTVIEPLTNPDLLLQTQNEMEEYKNEFLLYQEQNPDRLEGIWKGKTKLMMNTYFLECSFEGDRIIHKCESKTLNMRPFIVEGRLYYSENIIILVPLRATDKDKEVVDFGKQAKYVWYYELDGDDLHFDGAKAFRIGWPNMGDLQRGK